MNNVINVRQFIKLGRVAIVIQLLSIIAGILISILWGAPFDSALDYFTSLENNKIVALLRDDSYNQLLIFMYIFSFTAIWFLMNKHNLLLTYLALTGTILAVILTLSSNPGFSMLFLFEKYEVATDDAVRQQLLAAGEALISRNMWHSTNSFYAGILLQGGGVLISLAMRGSTSFGKLTIISGLLANGLDLINHLIHYIYPSVAELFLMTAGVFYLLWFISLFRDFTLYLNKERK